VDLLAAPERPGYWIRRRNWFMGRWMDRGGWGGDRVLRLFDRERGRYDDRAVHEAVVIEGEAHGLPTLRNPLLHYAFRSFDDYVPKLDRYARLGAEEAGRKGKRAGLRRLLLHPLAAFIRSYILKGGFLAGRRGLLVAQMTAFSTWMKYARLYEEEASDSQEEKIPTDAGSP
jgi:hypothetical protein